MSLQNGHADGADDSPGVNGVAPTAIRFSDIPSAIDIPVSGFDSDEVEISLEELPDDPTELCTLLDNEKAAKNFWVIIALAYAKKDQLDHAIEILGRGLASLTQGVTREKLGLLNWMAWLYMLKSRHAPRVAPEANSGVRVKEHYLQEATLALNEATRLSPTYPPLYLARGVLSILRASLQPPAKALRPGMVDTSERMDTLRQAAKCFDESSKASNNRNMMAVLGKARANYLLGRYGEALEGYQQALMKMPHLTDPDPRIGIGCCLWQLDFKDHAKTAWSRALVLNPESKVANILLGAYHLYDSSRYSTSDPQFISRYKVAMTQHTQTAFKLDKEDPITCSMFGGYFLFRKHFPMVEVLARKAIELTDVNATASDGWYLLARKEHYQGNQSAASEHYSRSDQARGGGDRGYLPAKFGTVQVLIRSGDVAGAKFRLEKMIQQRKNPEPMTLLGALYAEEVFAAQARGLKEDKSGEVKKAITLLESVRAAWRDEKKKVAPDESVLLYLARLYETSAPDKSMQCLQQVENMQLSQIPEEEWPDIEDEEERRAKLRETLSPQLLNNMGCFLYQAEKLAPATSMFQTALTTCANATEEGSVADDGSVTTINYNLGRTYESVGLTEEAKRTYGEVLRRHSDYTEANARLTYMWLRESPTGEGPKKMAKLYEVESTNLEVRALYGWFLNRSKRKAANVAEDQEQRHYKHTIMGYDKHDRYALTGMGNIYLLAARGMRGNDPENKRRKTYERAVEIFDKALQLDPKNAYAAQGVAIALVDDRKDYNTAAQIFAKVRDTLKDTSVYLNLGHVYAELKQFNRSIESYEMALSKDRGRDAQILTCLGRVWLLKGMSEKKMPMLNKALEYTQRARDVAPEQTHLQFNIAYVQNQMVNTILSLPQFHKTTQEVQAAMDGLDEAMETLTKLSEHPRPPYPADSLQLRANMCRTMRSRLQRVLQSQSEYETANAAKMQQARQARDAAVRARHEEEASRAAAEAERQRSIAADRARLAEEAARIAEAQAAEQRAREEAAAAAADQSDETDSGEKEKRRRRGAGKKTRRKKKRADSDEEGEGGGEREREEERERGREARERSATSPAAGEGSGSGGGEQPQRKRRRLERGTGRNQGEGKEGKEGLYKSSELVVDSDEEAVAAPSGSGTVAAGERADGAEDEGGDDLFGDGGGREGEDTVMGEAEKDYGSGEGEGQGEGGGAEEPDDDEGPAVRRGRRGARRVADEEGEDEEQERGGEGAGDQTRENGADDLFGDGDGD